LPDKHGLIGGPKYPKQMLDPSLSPTPGPTNRRLVVMRAIERFMFIIRGHRCQKVRRALITENSWEVSWPNSPYEAYDSSFLDTLTNGTEFWHDVPFSEKEMAVTPKKSEK